ncbi:MAG: biotin/lipoyl-binding protein [Betaproteobacteria bacterium]|nr:biotin/lipoyl-binding protein [Betaproteobacteria bacterium]
MKADVWPARPLLSSCRLATLLQPIRGRWAIVVAQRFGSRHRQEGPAPKGLKLVWVLFRDTFRYDPSGRERLSTQLIFVILLAALSIGTWSVVMEIDQVINADAKVISSAKLQTIEHFEGGRIERIHVKAGDAVKPGDLLLTLSPLQAQNEKDAKALRCPQVWLQVTPTPCAPRQACCASVRRNLPRASGNDRPRSPVLRQNSKRQLQARTPSNRSG